MTRPLALFLGFLLFASLPVPAWSKEKDRACTAAEKKAADRQLWLNERDQKIAVRTHLPWGAPAITPDTSKERMLTQRDYVIRYDGDLRIPLFTAERVDADRLQKKVKRTDCFRRDVRIKSPDDSSPTDYKEPLFDQGHLAAFANQATSVIAGNNSFIMSNMTPQNCQFNRGIWQILEGIVRLWAAEKKTVYVISGSVFDRDSDGLRDLDTAAARMTASNHTARVAVPTGFYKIVAFTNADGSIDTLTFVLPHNQANPEGPTAVQYLQNHVTSLRDIERRTGLGFFPTHPVIHESSTLWAFDQHKMPGSLCHAPPTPKFDALWQH